MEGRRGRVWVHRGEEREGVGTWMGGEGAFKTSPTSCMPMQYLEEYRSSSFHSVRNVPEPRVAIYI